MPRKNSKKPFGSSVCSRNKSSTKRKTGTGKKLNLKRVVSPNKAALKTDIPVTDDDIAAIAGVMEVVKAKGFEMTLETLSDEVGDFCSVHLTSSSSSEEDVDLTITIGKVRSDAKTVFDIDKVEEP